MDEDWRNAFVILMCMEICDGAGAGICDGSPSTCSSSSYHPEMKNGWIDGRLKDRRTDRHMDVQHETIIPPYYRVAGYKNSGV